MYGRFVSLLIAVLWAAVAAPAGAQQLELFPDDARLETKVTVEADQVMLAELMEQLSEDSGVSLRAGTSERDWEVREQRVTIRAADVPLREVLQQVSTLLDYQISRTSKEPPHAYLIWQDSSSSSLQNELVAAQHAEAAERIQRVREGVLASAREALEMTEAEAYVQKDTDPWLAYLGGTKSGRGYAALLDMVSQNFPIQRDLLMRGKRATVPLENLPPELYQGFLDTVESGVIASQIRSMGMESQMEDIMPHAMVFMSSEGMGGETTGVLGLTGMVFLTGRKPGMEIDSDGEFGGGIPVSFFPLANSGSLMGGIFGRMFFALDEGATMEEAQAQMMDYLKDPAVLASALGRTSELEENPPEDEALTREVDLKDFPGADMVRATSQGPKMEGETVQALTKALGIPVYVESFGTGAMPLNMALVPGKQPLYRVLAALEKAGFIWEMTEGALQIRSENWAVLRTYQIPERTMNGYRKTLEDKGEFSLADLAEMARELSDEQIMNTVVGDPKLSLATASVFANPMSGALSLLRLYGSLNAGQKAALHAEEGLVFEDITDGQWDHMSDLITDKTGGIVVVGGSLRIRPTPDMGENAPPMQMTIFEFDVLAEGEEKPRRWEQVVVIPKKDQIDSIRKMQLPGEPDEEKPEGPPATEEPPPAAP